MVSPQLLLGVGLAIPLLLIGLYVAWLTFRLEHLEDRLEASEQSEGREDVES